MTLSIKVECCYAVSFMLTVVNADCVNAECHYAECRYAERLRRKKLPGTHKHSSLLRSLVEKVS
jgi:hypothetical protein